ncbi:replication initiator protein WhiP [Pyrodictium abyssi]|uniref:Replication initiator protein WhiP n=1 Tax=Pyrodictium abyssi TaxID=54256 RepID=A0ABM8IV20_9CREN|nr:hypothetical protein PABY_09650 [Pyrodictium abyssi]
MRGRSSDELEALPELLDTGSTPAKKQRGGPRSRLVEAIAVLLLARPMRAAEIAQVLGKSTRYVSSYLSYWRTRGLFEYENGFWVLTPEGEEFARNILEREMNSRVAQYAALARQIVSDKPLHVTPTMKHKDGLRSSQQSGEPQPFIVSLTINADNKTQEQLLASCSRALLEELDIDDDERHVLELLLEHYRRWNMTYMYLDQLERELEADRVWLVGVLRSLQTKGLVYLYNDRRLGMRIGLSRKVKNALSACMRAIL